MTTVLRLTFSPLLLKLLSLTLVLTFLVSTGGSGQLNLTAFTTVAAVLAVAVLVVVAARGPLLALGTAANTGPVSDERRLRGAFRRVSNPDTPGRPRPRAPGSVVRPA